MKNVTAEGKARVSQNVRKFGLFSVTAFIRPEEQELFADFNRGYTAELSPATPLEESLAREIVHAAWRLRRCADLETNAPENLTDEELDRLQISVDRARAAAQRTLHRSLKELRRLQGERLYIRTALPASIPDSAKQSQLPPPVPASIARNALCPCRSGAKYKRCCGKSAAPVLSAVPVRTAFTEPRVSPEPRA